MSAVELTAEQKDALLDAAFAPDCPGILAAAAGQSIGRRSLMHALRSDAAFAREVQDAERLRQQQAREELVAAAEDESIAEKTRVAIRRDLAKKGSPVQLMTLTSPDELILEDAADLFTEAVATANEADARELVGLREACDSVPCRPSRGRHDWEAIQRRILRDASPADASKLTDWRADPATGDSAAGSA